MADYMADMTAATTPCTAAAATIPRRFLRQFAALRRGRQRLRYAAGGSGLLDGGDGDDYITAPNGNYILVGGAGDDTFEFAGTVRQASPAARAPMSSPTA